MCACLTTVRGAPHNMRAMSYTKSTVALDHEAQVVVEVNANAVDARDVQLQLASEDPSVRYDLDEATSDGQRE